MGDIFEIEILVDLHVLSPTNTKITFLVVNLSLSVCVCVSDISLAQKQIIEKTPN